MVDLRVDFCSHEAAKYACEHWHYSKCVPSGKLIKVGAWEDGNFIGVVLFSRGANNNIGKPYNLTQTQCCELTRVALNKHISPVTQIISFAISFLKRINTGLKLVISYADTNQGHLGIIYQAGNWLYCGLTDRQTAYWLKGRWVHSKTAN